MFLLKTSPKQRPYSNKVSDLHMHLNGSFSLSFIESLAHRYKRDDLYQQLVDARRLYAEKSEEKRDGQYTPEAVKLIWAQFGLIHQITSLGSLRESITDGTLDVIAHSTARYLEIRTTPKSNASGDWNAYVDAFVEGLRLGREQFQGQKMAYGLLSLDRTQCSVEEGFAIIDRVAHEKSVSGLLVGIDVSGNPLAPRTLTGGDFGKVIEYALKKEIGVAIHFGEADTDIEKQDSSVVLRVLETWVAQQEPGVPNPLHGKVRLGHVIHLTSEHQECIRRLKIPIEICPTCHQKVNWWKHETKHPGTSIYEHWREPVVSGTDDEIIFGADAREENKTVLRTFGYDQEKFSDGREHQSSFRFG